MATKPFTDSTSGFPSENLPYLRAYVARTIENLVGVLDALDPCVDLEDSDPLQIEEDACSAGDDGNRVHGQNDYEAGDPDDAEDDNEDCCDGGDDRPNCSGNPFWPEHIGIGDDTDAEEDDPLEDNWDRELTNDDLLDPNTGWRKTAKDRQLITDNKRHFNSPAGRSVWRGERRAIKRFILEKANDA